MNLSRNEKGSALIFAMIAIGVVTAIVSTSMQRISVDTSIAGTWNKATRATEVADTGLKLTAHLVASAFVNDGSINEYLSTVQFGTASGGQYAVIVSDNDDVGGVDQDGDGNAETDADQIFRLIATGAVGQSEHVIDAYFRVNAGAEDPESPGSDGIGALGICADNADVSSAANVTGEDYSVPPFPCSGSACRGSLSGNPDNTGISYNTGTTVSLSGTPGGSPPSNSNAGIDCTAWEEFLTSTAANADTTLTAAGGPYNGSAVTDSFGDDSDPKIVVIEGTGGETVQFNGTLNGAGILIIRDCNVKFLGTFTFAGLVLIEDDGGGISLSGNSNIFGSMMVLSSTVSDSQVEMSSSGKKDNVKYSTEGLGYVDSALSGSGAGGGGSLETIAWRVSQN